MNVLTREQLDLAGVTLALSAGGLHLVWGLPRFIIYARVGRMPDLRPPLFILGAVAVAVGAFLVFRSDRPRTGRWLIVAVMVGYLLGYVAWHMLGHPTLGPGFAVVTSAVHGPVTTVVEHLQADRFAFVTVVVELLALAAIGVVLRDG